MVRILYQCENCDFSFTDKDLIFYLDGKDENKEDNLDEILNEELDNLKIIEESLNKENSDKMTKALISGFLYENYCPHCNELIKTYVPEDNSLFSQEEIEKILIRYLKKENKYGKNTKIVFFDFKNTFYRARREILENNSCPNCKNEMSLVISTKIPCPKCGENLRETF